MDDILEPIDSFKNFNEFFYRKLKKNGFLFRFSFSLSVSFRSLFFWKTARPIANEDDLRVAVSPADCRLHVFRSVDDATKLWVKGKNFSLENLLWDSELAKRFFSPPFLSFSLPFFSLFFLSLFFSLFFFLSLLLFSFLSFPSPEDSVR